TDTHAKQDVERPKEAGDCGESDARRVRRVSSTVSEQRYTRAREGHPEQVERPPRAEHRDRQRAEELNGHRDPKRRAVERLVEREVHRHEDNAERDDELQVSTASPTDLRPCDRPERERTKQEAQED